MENVEELYNEFEENIKNIHEQYASEIKELKKQIEELEKVRKEVIKKRIEDYEEVARKIFVDLAYEVFEKTKENRILLYEGRIKEESYSFAIAGGAPGATYLPCIDLGIIPRHAELRLFLLKKGDNIYVDVEYYEPRNTKSNYDYTQSTEYKIKTLGRIEEFVNHVNSLLRNWVSVSDVYYIEPSIESLIRSLSKKLNNYIK